MLQSCAAGAFFRKVPDPANHGAYAARSGDFGESTTPDFPKKRNRSIVRTKEGASKIEIKRHGAPGRNVSAESAAPFYGIFQEGLGI